MLNYYEKKALLSLGFEVIVFADHKSGNKELVLRSPAFVERTEDYYDEPQRELITKIFPSQTQEKEIRQFIYNILKEYLEKYKKVLRHFDEI